jgi:hypothetical protein
VEDVKSLANPAGALIYLTHKLQSQNADFLVLDFSGSEELSSLPIRSLLVDGFRDNMLVEHTRLQLFVNDFLDDFLVIEFVHDASVYLLQVNIQTISMATSDLLSI